MDETRLIHDWNVTDGEFSRDASRHPHEIWFDDETLRDGLQSPSALNPSIEQRRNSSITWSTRPSAGRSWPPRSWPVPHRPHRRHAQSHQRKRLRHQPGCAVRTVVSDIEPLVDLQAKHGMDIQASAFLGTSPIRMYAENWTMEKLLNTMEGAVGYAVENDIPVMFVTEDTTRSKPEDIVQVYQRALELGVRRFVCATRAGTSRPTVFAASSASSTSTSSRTPASSAQRSRSTGTGTRPWSRCCEQPRCRQAGADVIHGTALGLGERSGNAPLDQTLVNLKLMGAIDNDLTLLGEYVKKAHAYTGVPLPATTPCLETMRSRQVRASTPPRSSRPCARATIGLLIVSIGGVPRATSGFNSAFASATWRGVQTSSTGLSSAGWTRATTLSPTCSTSPSRSAA
ncbi:MAG: hypothetical protein CM15mP128_0250 [Methanobacteriota archaeon]|nr:MAG: hypothetical protein CM15mP128_0250 [Euryarchaeota archaeon]